MKKNELDTPNVKTTIHTLKITDFAPYTEISKNFFIGKELTSVNHIVSTVNAIPSNVYSAYCLNDRIIFYSGEKYLYEYISPSLKKLEECLSQPSLLPVMLNGTQEMVVTTSTDSYLLGKNEIKFNFPKGAYSANYKNRAFFSLTRNLYFSGDFNFTTLSMDLVNLSHISVSMNDGTIIGLIPYEDDLMVFCQKAIYKLHISANNEISFTKSNEYTLDIKTNSIAKVGSEIFFISNKYLCSYKNGKIERHETIYEDFVMNSTLMSAVCKEYYVKTFKKDGETYIYMYDTVKRRSHLIDGKGCEFIGDNCLINKTAKYMYKISNGQPSFLSWTSKKINFGTCHKKKIVEIELYSSNNATLYLYSNAGNKVFAIWEGYNCKKLNLVCNEFYLNIYAYKNAITITDLKIKYKIIGE